MSEIIHLYTDGAASNNPGPAGIGVLLKCGPHKKEISRYLGNQTNNVAELTAIKVGLETLTVFDKPILIYTDSQYSIGMLSLNWNAKKNQQLISVIKQLMSKFSNIKFIKVKGHSGQVENEIVDKLAVKAYKPHTGG